LLGIYFPSTGGAVPPAARRSRVCLVTADYRRPMSMFTADHRKLQENVKLTTFTQITNINGRCARRPSRYFRIFYDVL